MIKLKDLLNENYIALDLSEANAGYSSMLVQKDLSNKIYNAFIKLLEDIPQKDIPIKYLIGKMDLIKQINIV